VLEYYNGLTTFHYLLAGSAFQFLEHFFIIVHFVLKSFVSAKLAQINYQYFTEIYFSFKIQCSVINKFSYFLQFVIKYILRLVITVRSC